MKSFELMPLRRFAQMPTVGDGRLVAQIAQPAEEMLDTSSSEVVVLGIEVFRATAVDAASRPWLEIQTCDEASRDVWTTVFSTAKAAGPDVSGNHILTLLKSVPIGESFRLGRFLRWVVKFNPDGVLTDPAILNCRITATEG